MPRRKSQASPGSSARRILRFRHRDPRPPGATPGTGQYVGEAERTATVIRVFDYGAEGIREKEVSDGRECGAFEARDSPAWIQVTGLHDHERIGGLLETYGIHPLVRDDILNTNQHPKVEDFGDYLFVTARQVSRDAGTAETGSLFGLQHFALILTDRVVLTFHELPSAVFDPVISRLRSPNSRLRARGPDFLAWAVLDAVLDQWLYVLDDVSDGVTRMDETLSTERGTADPRDIHRLGAQVNFLVRVIRPMREVAMLLQRSESPLLTPEVRPFLRDLHDHAWHAIDTADHLRESVAGIRDFHQAESSRRMNAVMQVLTAISTIFLPLSFLAGVYGMNVEIPEARSPWAYPAIWTAFVLIGGGMFLYFRRRRWL